MKILSKPPQAFLAIALSVLLLSCNKQDDEVFRTNSFEPPEVTGYEARNLFGELMFIIGQPNIKLGDVSNDNFNNTYYIQAFPNPTDHVLRVFFDTPQNANKKIWLSPANKSSQLQYDMANTAYIGGTPVMQVETTEDHINLQVSNIDPGFYKLYVEVGGHLLHDNILITH